MRRFRTYSRCGWLPLGALVWLLCGATCLAAGADDIEQQARLARAAYRTGLKELVAWCESKALAAEAQTTQRSIAPADPYKIYLPELPKRVGPPPAPEGATADQTEWHTRYWKLRRDYGQSAYELARRAAKLRRACLAFDLGLQAIYADPDHEAVRRLMGYQKLKGQWCTAYEAKRLRAGQVWDDRFGWLTPQQLAKYEKGQRQAGGKWISAAEDARLHSEMSTGWDIETEHYTIRTNHSLEAGVALGTKLENLYRIWLQLFAGYYASEAQIIALFDERKAKPLELPRHRIAYFRDQLDYNRTLKGDIPNVEITIGAYLQQHRRAYFFAGKEPDDRTLYHEATHQLFHESRPVVANVAQKANFWIVEGIAMFMESLHREGDLFALGGFQDERLFAARHRLLKDDFYVPLSDFTAFGMLQLQNDPRIATLYSQAAGLTHFLVFGEGNRYRDALVIYLAAVYTGRDEPGTLARLTETPYLTLDKQYRAFMEKAPAAP